MEARIYLTWWGLGLTTKAKMTQSRRIEAKNMSNSIFICAACATPLGNHVGCL